MTKPDKTDYEVPEMQENHVRMDKCNELKKKKSGKCCSIFRKQIMMKKPKTKFEVGGNIAILFLDTDKTGFIGCFVLSTSILM